MDETKLFSYNHDKNKESKTFPFWKPVLINNKWQFKNHQDKFLLDGKAELFPEFLGDHMFPEQVKNYLKSQKYQSFDVFVTYWAQMLTFYKSVKLFNETMEELKKTNLKPNQQENQARQKVAEFFESLKEI